jgi:hypothetical protein
MPVGAIIGAAGTIGGALLASSSNKSAAKTAANAQIQASTQSNALQRDIYNQNKALLTPYSSNGLRASNALTELLLGPGGATTPALSGAAPAGAMSSAQQFARPTTGAGRMLAREALDGTPQFSRNDSFYTTAAPAAGGGGTTSALGAWDQFRQGTNYQWRLNEGMRGLDASLASEGMSNSGAAVREAMKLGQNMASAEIGNYMNLLAGQQQMGMGAASAVAGVGQNYAGAVNANTMNAANATSNAALVAGANNASVYGAAANGIGQIVGAAGSSYNRPVYTTPPYNPSNYPQGANW